MSEPLFSSLLTNSVEFKTWPLIDVNIWLSSLFGNGKVLP